MLVVLALLASAGFAAAGNRSSCFRYVDCHEKAQSHLKDCSGGTAVALTLESKDASVADLVRNRGKIVNMCQDRLTAEIVDFDTLQVLVNEDARECFEKLPGSSKTVEFNPSNCTYVPMAERDHYGKDTYQCALEYFADRQHCEQLLQCCPDHARCGERMNAVSVAYQHARAKSLQIVSNVLRCIVSNDPTAVVLVAKLQNQRSSLRNAGLPLYRPDMATEERITRRLSLTSQSAMDLRRQRFNRRYHQVRALLSQRVRGVSLESTRGNTAATQVPSERRVAIVRNLLRNADDQELATYVSLIADGDFAKLSQLEREKVARLSNEEQVDEAMHKMQKIRDAIKAALATKESKTLDFLQTSSATNEKILTAQAPEDDWHTETPAHLASLGQIMATIDSETLVRAKKFATAVEEALNAQKELILSTKDTFTGNGIPSSRTSSRAPLRNDRIVHDFDALTTKLREESGRQPDDAKLPAVTSTAAVAESEETTTVGPVTRLEIDETLTILPLAESRMVSISQPKPLRVDSEITHAEVVEEGSGLAVEDLHNTTIIADDATNSTDEVAQSVDTPLVSLLIADDIAEKVKETTQESAISNATIAESKENVLEALDGGEKREKTEVTVVPEEKVEQEQKRAIDEQDDDKDDKKVSGDIIVNDKDTEHVSLETLIATAESELALLKNGTDEATTEAPVIEEQTKSIAQEAKEMMTKFIKDMKNTMIKIKEKLSLEAASTSTTTTTTEVPVEVTSSAASEAPVVEAESVVEGSGSATEDAPVPPPLVIDESTLEVPSTSTTTAAPVDVKKDTQPNHCATFATCDELVRDYRDQCDRRYNKDLISHGIDDSEILTILSNSSISQHDIVMKACLRPLDKSAHSSLKQLLIIERGVRRACLELGRNRHVLTAEQTAVCHSELPSTEALDNFLSSEHARSQDNHLTCLAKLAPFHDHCQSRSECCASVNACDKYIAASPVRRMREESIQTLVKRQTACEERMIETLKYIQQQLASRRRRH